MYLFALLFFSVFAFLEVFNKEIIEKNKYIFATTCYIFLVFHDGLRWETGTDWDIYLNFFQSIRNISYEDPVFEPAYMLLFSSVKVFTDDYSAYLLIHAILFHAAFFYVIFKLSDFPFISLLIFYMIIVPYLGMNRQFLAMAIYGIALVFFIEGKKWAFFLFMALAFLFHKTAILALPILLLNYKIPKIYIIIGLCTCVIISLSGILNSLSFLATLIVSGDETADKKLDIYMHEDKEISIISTTLSIIKKVIWLSLLLIFEPIIENKDKKYNILRNIYIAGIMVYLLFNGTALQIITSRGLLYYNLAEMFIIPYVLTIFKQNYGKLLIMFVLVLYCAINIYKGFSNYGEGTDYFEPYKGLFINTDYVRQYTD